MTYFKWGLEAVAVVLGLLVLLGLAFVLRRRFLAREGGAFELAKRDAAARPGYGWQLGFGRYRGGNLEWFPVFSVWPRPRSVWARSHINVVEQRAPDGLEAHSLYEGHVIVRCTTATDEVELAMGSDSLMGFSSWLESGPPGLHNNKA